jgi:hypothetical protein
MSRVRPVRQYEAGTDPRDRSRLPLVKAFLAPRRELYELHRDPFRAFEAFWLAWTHRMDGVAMPPWVTAYLERVSLAVIRVSRQIDLEGLTGETLDRAILRALEFKGRGRGTLVARRGTLRRGQQYAMDVVALRRRGHKVDTAVTMVANLHRVNRSTVLRAYELLRARGRFVTAGGWDKVPNPSPGLPTT